MKKFAAVLLMAALLVLVSCGGTTDGTPRNGNGINEDNGNVGNTQGGTASVSVGEIIEFGATNWRVLDVDGNRALLLSETIVSNQSYHYTSETVTWETSTLREWLNDSFYNNTFIAEERARIAETRIVNNSNPWVGTDGGIDTVDKIFLLSIEEVVRYLGDSGQLANRPSGAFRIDDEFNNARIARNADGAEGQWWLRSPGGSSFRAADVDGGGYVWSVYGSRVNYTGGGVRPALWLNLES